MQWSRRHLIQQSMKLFLLCIAIEPLRLTFTETNYFAPRELFPRARKYFVVRPFKNGSV